MTQSFGFFLLFFLAICSVARASTTIEERIQADGRCLMGSKVLDDINVAENRNRGSVGDIIRLAEQGLRSATACKDPDAASYLRGMLTSRLGIAQTFTDYREGAKTLQRALPDLDRCSAHRDIFGITLQGRCRAQAIRNRDLVARLPRPTHPER